ncbi:DUF4352 domain-containing protein [Marinactinospora thermotolerans]|uniref:Uncharacterized protein n=1 Tax=Marinactinospora thermotolerans DSM 45154 TaxID=1122192 RepID=A0A1T4KL47_9ACTN|nr:DUF4352 domain-containing protein [Marinactinospora thermotolerans]SJZ43125.1 protein of unknown function [Marinactinospora thermotolerans DSM 45154]
MDQHPQQPVPSSSPAPSSSPKSRNGAPRWIVLVAAAAVAFGVGIAAGWFGHQTFGVTTIEGALAGGGGEPAQAVDQAGEAPEGPPPLGTTSDGLFEYEVVSIDRAASYDDTECGNQYQAAGEFVTVTLGATNIGNAAAIPAVDPGEVTAWSAEGNSYSTFIDICSFADSTNPGNSTEYTVTFDVPEGTEFSVLEITSYESSKTAVILAE